MKFVLLFAFLFLALIGAQAGTYTLTDGQTITAEPVSYNKDGVIFSGNLSNRIPWSKFSQASLQQLQAEAKKPADAEFIEPFLEQTIQEDTQRAEIQITQPDRIERPTGNKGLSAMFSSSIGLFIFLVLYAANIYAAYEVALFKNMPFPMVCGAAAVVPFLAPIVFMFLPARLDVVDQRVLETHEALEEQRLQSGEPQEPAHHELETHEHADHPEGATHHPGTPAMHFNVPQQTSSPAPAQPSITFRRGEFTFNRRFFETKMPGFLRVVPGEAEKDMVLVVRAIRGEFVAKRISKITQTEAHLETFKDNTTAEEIVPFTEIQEVSIRHKDAI